MLLHGRRTKLATAAGIKPNAPIKPAVSLVPIATRGVFWSKDKVSLEVLR